MVANDTQPQDRSVEADPVRVSDRDGVRTITLNRPAAYNSFNLELKSALLAALAAAAAEDSVRAVVVTGAGRAFCAGQDLKEHLALVNSSDPRLASTVRDFYNPLVLAVTGMAKPVIAAVNGAAAGAGAGLAFACDLRVAAASASFSMAFAAVALSADTGSSYLLPRLIGYGRASRMLLLGEKIDATEGLRIGMVDLVVDDGELADTAARLAGSLATGPALALSRIKASLQYAAASDLPAALAFEDRAQTECFASPDHLEAIQAFVEKRPARYR
ncbi:MAG: enoyl-CoA hydratase-related protein [Nakamurella sp.]